MKPVRDRKYLAFIRSLPCCISGCQRGGVDAAHVGSRGMGQKCSDRETIPLCRYHHREQHRIGLVAFLRIYNLDAAGLIRELNEKPRLFQKPVVFDIVEGVAAPTVAAGAESWRVHWFAQYRDEVFRLMPVSFGWEESMELARELCREYLIHTLFTVSALRRPGVAARTAESNNREVGS